ncbi:PD-(D/E)XK nuclease family transposase [[Ruminococcus] torques]|uniref:PD-(D/E)XK nuclease family transposase n=1 Tax=[Ruminococcus] torques TaxID=33039 RepID=A0A564SAN5_9FIRM|nr:PD-(D/E)XK nuclease family transposase [[Ruminococcus] torques]VUW92197.1 PD-(D/E)XK nuclease family transposase [[Ruminococcus] torques]
MKNKLQNYFPMIRTQGEVLSELRENTKLWKTFCEWEGKYQQEYLDICTGVKGVKLLYDTYFKAVMNPDTRPERLNDFLSEILGKKVKILKVLPNESAQIAAESSLLIMDIVVQFEDGSIANVEVQKIGYLFPGQRSACYSSDLLLRQYKRVRAELGQGFTYRKIQKVYTIVLFEKSNSDFSKFSKEIYIHHFEQKSDTGVEMNLLQEYTFICLDIFGDIIQNEDRKIENRLEEWLVFLSQDDPDMIIKLLNQNADFQEIYEEVYTICLNMERMMEMFSKELAILDRNTVKLMIDEMEEEVVEAKRKADEAVRKADEAVRKADEAVRKADEAESRADEAESRADEAESRAKQAEHREKQAREEVDNLKKELEKMKNI